MKLFAVWLLLTVLGPHQDLYKIFFHVFVIPSVLVLLLSRKVRINWKDPLLITVLLLIVYSSISTFVVGSGPFKDHFRALRWGVEAFFCVMAFYIWLPRLLSAPGKWGNYLLLLSIFGSFGGFVLFLFVPGFIDNRLSGLGVLHNPIEASSVLIIYLAAGYYLTFMRRSSQVDIVSTRLMITGVISVTFFVIMSQSRGPVIAMAVFLIFPVLHIFARLTLLKSLMLTITGATLLLAFLSYVYGLDYYKELMFLRGSSYRFDIWRGYFLYPPDSWFFGFGAGTAPENLEAAKAFWGPAGVPATHAHNLMLGTLFGTGVIGFSMLIVMAGFLIKSVFASPVGDFQKIGRIMMLLLFFLLTLTSSFTLVSSIKAIWLYGWFPLLLVWFSGCYYNKIQ